MRAIALGDKLADGAATGHARLTDYLYLPQSAAHAPPRSTRTIAWRTGSRSSTKKKRRSKKFPAGRTPSACGGVVSG